MGESTYKEKDILLFLLGAVVIPYTAYQTAQGYRLFTEGSLRGWALPIIIAIALAYTFIELKNKVNVGDKQGARKMLVSYLVVASLSFIGNFNAFYSSGIKRRLASEYFSQLEQNIALLKNDFSGSNQQFIEKVESLQSQIKNQIEDPKRRGFGDEAKKLASEFKDLFGVEITKPGGTVKEQSENVIRQITNLMEIKNKSSEELLRQLDPSIEKTTVNVITKDIAAARATDDSYADDQKAIVPSINSYNSLCQQARNVIKKDKNSTFSCKEMTYVDEAIGTIPHSFASAIAHPKEAVIPFIISGLLDFLLPVLIFIPAIGGKKQGLKFPTRGKAEKK